MWVSLEIPIWQKSNLNIKEASVYFNIGEAKLRNMIQEIDCDYVIYIGKKALIKRKKLEEYLSDKKYI